MAYKYNGRPWQDIVDPGDKRWIAKHYPHLIIDNAWLWKNSTGYTLRCNICNYYDSMSIADLHNFKYRCKSRGAAMIHSVEEKLLELDSIVVESIFPVRTHIKHGHILVPFPKGVYQRSLYTTILNSGIYCVTIPLTDFDTVPLWDIYNKYLKGIFHTHLLEKDEFEP